MLFEGRNPDNKLGRFVPEVPLARGRRGRPQPQQPRPKQESQPRNIESALGAYADQMRTTLADTLTRKKGIFQVQYRIEPSIKDNGASAELLLDVVKITCRQETDVPLLIQEFLESLNDKIDKRPGENIRLFTETEKIKVERVQPKDEPEYEKLEHAIELESKTAGGERTPEWLASRLRAMYGKFRKKDKGEAVVADPYLKKIASERYALRRENAKLKGRAEAAERESASRHSEIEARKQEIVGLRKNISELQADLRTREAAHTELERRLAALDAEKKNIVAQSEAARLDEAQKRAALDAAIVQHKGDYEKLLAQYQKAHAAVDATEKKLRENEADRRALTERLRAALALEESMRENIVHLEADLAEKSRAAEEAALNRTKFERQQEENARLQRVNDELVARIDQLESGSGADKQAFERVQGEVAGQKLEIERLRVRLAESEKMGSGLHLALERFATVLRKLAADDATSVESRDGALMGLRFLSAVTQDEASENPEEMKATNALLQEFEDILRGKTE
jgi:chromosome segregation ATPase